MNKDYESVMDSTPRFHDDGWSVWYPFYGPENLHPFLFRGDIIQLLDDQSRPLGCLMVYAGITKSSFPKNAAYYRYLLNDSVGCSGNEDVTITISREDFEEFLSVCSNYPEPSKALMRAFCRKSGRKNNG